MLRLLYGVQATGNGHISRARALQKALAAYPIAIDFLFSGRPADKLFEMSAFGDYQWRQGLTFVSVSGQVCWRQTWREANLCQFWQDVRQLDTRSYDLVLTDFEPITAWAAKLQNTPVIGIGHQYACHSLPKPVGMPFWQRQLLKWYAPAQTRIGLHWHHFDQMPGASQVILPPIIDLTLAATRPDLSAKEHCRTAISTVLVYLPFESTTDVLRWFSPLSEFQFVIYGVSEPAQAPAHLRFCPPSVQGFRQALYQCTAVISNAGFELISEALQLQKPILVKPLKGQSEQESNAAALQLLGLAQSCAQLSTETLSTFLSALHTLKQISYPDVATTLARWLACSNRADLQELFLIWRQN